MNIEKKGNRFRDLSNMTFGRLTAISPIKKDYSSKYYWECVCSCGRSVTVLGSNLLRGNSNSCGCLKNERIGALNLQHNMSKTRMYKIWAGMRKRCLNKNAKSYEMYGGRGIKISKDWDTFLGFYNDMKIGYSDKYTLERIDVNGDYCKENCKWATMREQATNRRSNRYIEYDNKKLTVRQWEEISGVDRYSISWRIRKGWDIGDAIFGKGCESLEEISKYLVN